MDKRTSDHKSDPQSSENQDRPKGKTPSTAPNTSMETGAGEGATLAVAPETAGCDPGQFTIRSRFTARKVPGG